MAGEEEGNILLPGPEQQTTSYAWPHVVCNALRLWFRIDVEPRDGGPSQAPETHPVHSEF